VNTYTKDLLERVAVTFFQGTVGALIVTELADKEMWLAAVGGGVAAVVSLLKGLAAKRYGNPDSASLSGGV
jgi:hypothetical protein